MALKSRLRRALTSSSSTTTITTTTTPSNSSTTTSTPATTPPTSSTSSTISLPQLAHTPTVLATSPTDPSTPLTKTPSRLRLLLSRASTKSSKKSAKDSLHPGWHDYTGPRSRFRKAVDPLHWARLEGWSWEDSYGRSGSVASWGVSPGGSRVGSLDLRREEEDEA